MIAGCRGEDDWEVLGKHLSDTSGGLLERSHDLCRDAIVDFGKNRESLRSFGCDINEEKSSSSWTRTVDHRLKQQRKRSVAKTERAAGVRSSAITWRAVGEQQSSCGVLGPLLSEGTTQQYFVVLEYANGGYRRWARREMGAPPSRCRVKAFTLDSDVAIAVT